jgi:hypothetical protein
MQKKIDTRTILIGVGIVLLLILLLPIHLPYNLIVQGKVLPGQVWLLQRQTDGSMLVTLRDHRQNIVASYTAYQVERGDVLSFNLSPRLRSDGQVTTGDTIGFIHSNVINGEMANLRGSLDVARSVLYVNNTGEKQSLVEAARNQLSLSREQAQLQNKILERQKDLYDSNLVSREMYEITQGTSKIYDLQALVAEAQLKALETGSKPEQIQLSLSEINSLESEIKVLEQRLDQFVLISPLQGELFTSFSAESLMFIADTSRLVYMPVGLRDLAEVKVSQLFQVRTPVGAEVINGKIVRIDQLVQRLNDQQVFFAIGLLEKRTALLPLNQIVPCTIKGEDKTPWNYLGKIIQSMFN